MCLTTNLPRQIGEKNSEHVPVLNGKLPMQTFAALRSIVGIASCAVATFHGTRRVHTLAFTVAAAVAFRALVHV